MTTETHAKLYNLYRSEKDSGDLQEVPEGLFFTVGKEWQVLKETEEAKINVDTSERHRESNQLLRTIRAIHNMRARKLQQIAAVVASTGTLVYDLSHALQEEKWFFEAQVDLLKKYNYKTYLETKVAVQQPEPQ